MKQDPLVQQLVRLTREWNELEAALRRHDEEEAAGRVPNPTLVAEIEAGAARAPALLARLKSAQRDYARTHVVIDREDALKELRSRGEVTPELRLALARWVSNEAERPSSFKRGRKAKGVEREPTVAAEGERVATRDVLAVLRAFGSTSHPLGLERDARGVLIGLLTGARKLKTRSPGIAGTDADKVRNVIATLDAEARHREGAPKKAAISAAVEATRIMGLDEQEATRIMGVDEQLLPVELLPPVRRETVKQHYYRRQRRTRRGV